MYFYLPDTCKNKLIIWNKRNKHLNLHYKDKKQWATWLRLEYWKIETLCTHAYLFGEYEIMYAARTQLTWTHLRSLMSLKVFETLEIHLQNGKRACQKSRQQKSRWHFDICLELKSRFRASDKGFYPEICSKNGYFDVCDESQLTFWKYKFDLIDLWHSLNAIELFRRVMSGKWESGEIKEQRTGHSNCLDNHCNVCLKVSVSIKNV